MKVSKVLLRWYKSFNISYRQDEPARVSDARRPWNAINVSADLADDYPFIEIPIESDITTIVGGNESGKSHLLSAISKVIGGTGLEGDEFDQTDFCRYATVPSLSTDRWPNIGLQFTLEGPTELKAIQQELSTQTTVEEPKSITLVLGSEGGEQDEIVAYLYFNDDGQALRLTSDDLQRVRHHLPHVRFINARAALPDKLRLHELLTACGVTDDDRAIRFSDSLAQDVVRTLLEVSVDANNQITSTMKERIEGLQARVAISREDVTEDARLAAKLFTEVLEIAPKTLHRVLGQPPSRRGYIQYFLKDWNDRVYEKLDLAHFWQQDDQATLELVYKDDTLYFDITDKTDATYTFKERSSGLRYFLSYYIQAKALEVIGQQANSIILMDEPDSFLSILGQRNILAVFESLVGYEASTQTTQVVYSTHSPFLINRNFPRRIRVVTKEEAEEGTQYTGRGAARRYEPVRSALGIDCAETLFMGATNLVLEGLTDQYFVNEMCRVLATPELLHDVIDLNSVVVVSADGVGNIEKLLAASQWGDEPIPATTVLVDGDEAGRKAAAVITGQREGKKKLIDAEFVLILASDLHESLASITVETIEDLVPRSLYTRAFQSYLTKWYPALMDEHAKVVNERVRADVTGKGNVQFVKCICGDFDWLEEDFDKTGVLGCVIDAVRAEVAAREISKEVSELLDRVRTLFGSLNEAIESSRRTAARRSMTANIKRIIREFLRTRTHGCSLIDLRRHLQRLVREANAVDYVGERLRVTLEEWDSEAHRVEQEGQGRVVDDEWTVWRKRLEAIRRNPLAPTLPSEAEGSEQAKAPVAKVENE